MGGMTLLDMTDRLVSISDLSKGKAGRVFDDIEKNDHDYIIIKNNQPKAVIMSINEYRKTQERIARLEKFLEAIEDMRLLHKAENADTSQFISFEDLVRASGFTLEEIDALAETVEIE